MKLKKLFNLTVVLIISTSFQNRAVELDSTNLKSVKDVIFYMDINGVSYRRGYVNIRDRSIKDFNLEKVDKQLRAGKIPLDGEYVKELYQSTLSQLKKTGIRIKEIYNGDSSIIPHFVVSLEIKNVAADWYVVLIELILSDRVWLHPGKEKKTSVYIGYKKKLDIVKSGDLKPQLQKTVEQMITGYIDDRIRNQ